YLEAHLLRLGNAPRKPSDHKKSVRQTGNYRPSMQPGHRVGAKVGTDPPAQAVETLHANALIGPGVRPNENEAAVAQACQRRRLVGVDGRRVHLDFIAGREGVGVKYPNL